MSQPARPGAAAAGRSSPSPPIVAPSILSADFTRLADALAIPDPAREWVHCDVMDNHFVPNLTFGPLIVGAVRRMTAAFLDVHLMIEHPERLVDAFREAGADQITVHAEACSNPGAVLERVRASGARAGLSIKPDTPFRIAEPWLDGLDLLLVMTVEPGFGGQAFRPEMMPKVFEARQWREQHHANFLIEVDGGIAPGTARVARAAGADVFVAGHAIYGAADPAAALAELRRSVE
ncbi:MAG: ribulose-phosphate 3-epimerase [Candidatus Eiseniibacteriota bacterium]